MSVTAYLPVQGIIRVIRRGGNKDDFVGLMVTQADITKCSLCCMFFSENLVIVRMYMRWRAISRHLERLFWDPGCRGEGQTGRFRQRMGLQP